MTKINTKAMLSQGNNVMPP